MPSSPTFIPSPAFVSEIQVQELDFHQLGCHSEADIQRVVNLLRQPFLIEIKSLRLELYPALLLPIDYLYRLVPGEAVVHFL